MSNKKEEGDLLDSDAIELDEDDTPVFEFSVTQNADTDRVCDEGLYQAMETED